MAILLLILTACSAPMKLLAASHNSSDPCQNFYNTPNYVQPNWCGASSGTKLVTRDYYRGTPLTTTQVQR
jgi:hypothetical protein